MAEWRYSPFSLAGKEYKMVSGKDETAQFGRKLKMGQVGGGRDAFIGAVPRQRSVL